MINESFDRTKLSYRENEILELAIDGLTDQQIAHRLDISPSTVNSYWVRIRGKLGHLSRTELVSSVLRHEAQTEVDRLTLQRLELEQRLSRRESLLVDATSKAILDATPESLMALTEDGAILYANPCLAELFGYKLEDLVGESVTMLIPPRSRPSGRICILEYLQEPGIKRLGIDNVVYGRRRNGNEFRITLDIGTAPLGDDLIFTCLVREVLNEIDQMLSESAASVSLFQS